MVAFLAASSVPTPLYPLYQASWHFSTPMLTLAFAIYMFALLLTLLTTGPLSDYLGRRPVIFGALALEMVSMFCFLGANSLEGLFAARVLQGAATGIATSALAAMRPRAHIPAAVLPTFLRVIPANIAAWSLGGFSLSLGPILAKEVTGIENAMIGGLLVCLLTIMGAVSIWRMRGLATRTILLFAATFLPFGTAIVLASVYLHSTPLLLTGMTVAGFGFGGGFMGALRAIMPLAPAGGRSSLMAVFYIVSYLSASVPSLIAGLATQRFGLEATVYVYGSYVIALSLAALIGVLSQRQTSAVCG